MQDLHNHTVWSDGDNTVAEIYNNAMKHGVDEIGISDHYHKIKDYNGYLEELSRYPIKKSVEIMATYVIQKRVDVEWCNKNLDYVILEDFFDPMHIPAVAGNFIVPVIIAHPSPKVISCMVGMDIMYEINLAIPLPSRQTLKELTKNKIKVTVGSDIHNLCDYKPQLVELANKLAIVINKGYVPKWYTNE